MKTAHVREAFVDMGYTKLRDKTLRTPKCCAMSAFVDGSHFARTSHANSSEATVCGAAGGIGRRQLRREQAQYELLDVLSIGHLGQSIFKGMLRTLLLATGAAEFQPCSHAVTKPAQMS